MKSLSLTIQMKATERYFHVVLFVMLYKLDLSFPSVEEILKCENVTSQMKAAEQHL